MIYVTNPGINSSIIHLPGNSLNGGHQYRLAVEGQVEGSAYAIVNSTFWVNLPPSGGVCDVQPREGSPPKSSTNNICLKSLKILCLPSFFSKLQV